MCRGKASLDIALPIMTPGHTDATTSTGTMGQTAIVLAVREAGVNTPKLQGWEDRREETRCSYRYSAKNFV